ncbi:branched-chain amino acid aminotransferase [Salinicola sp. JS01]|uniref:branched-chain amino acid aminotransferase n=1 Tax=Salinicola sp. JS01 TaxID=3050071 RepID=UPI0004E741CD|nr:branched-chain amino acid aminotransferase [Salinicola sp. JS01]KFF48841.1 branched-chain amino acid aminotransferase [Gammaproteobacteria bacterium MFB021]MCE3026483.1 branched-chain amino acid aminotransferase [Salinicola sp. DM10]WIX31682.1 branched-chain amino acid aminotransferase [Salinicola sp. JS01]
MSTQGFEVRLSSNPLDANLRNEILANPGFGRFFTDHMVHVRWTKQDGWQRGELRPYGPLLIDPASPVLHYGQEIFEGIKAYRHADGSVWTFRPQKNAARFRASARRLALPELDDETFLGSLEALVSQDAAWVPTPQNDSEECSLYLRPFMIGNGKSLGVKPAAEVDYYLIASPAASYFKGGGKPVSIWLSSHYKRAAPGGTGFAKCGGNYAASLLAQAEAEQHGCAQVAFLDAAENKWIEELGGMNLFFVYRDGRLVTPALSGTILEGVTRDSILELARDAGLTPEERQISIDEWRDGVASGEITEVFACGTAAVITQIGELVSEDERIATPPVEGEAVSAQLRKRLLDIQYGRSEDTRGWLVRLA